MNEDELHELARLFMYQFTDLEPLSLDEFLCKYDDKFTSEQFELGNYISNLFNK